MPPGHKTIIGVMGPGHTDAQTIDDAFELGRLLAQEGWVVLSGGRAAGVMDAVSRGAKAAGGLTIGILPDRRLDKISPAVDLPIFTEMGNARNSINVLSSDVVIACCRGMGSGTASEIALAIKSARPVILLGADGATRSFFDGLVAAPIPVAATPAEAVALAKKLLAGS